MSLAVLPPKLVLPVAAALRDVQDTFALMRSNRGLHRWLKNQLYQYNVDNENSSGLLRAACKGSVPATYFFLDSARLDLHAQDEAGQTAFHITSPKKNDTLCIIMILLCDGHADINTLESEGQKSLFHMRQNRQ